MGSEILDTATLWNASAYCESGKCPWTIFAYPRSLADDRLLPRDEESVRYLQALVAAGAQVGVWYLPANETVYFACPFEEWQHIEGIVEELERQGAFPKNFALSRTEYLIQMASTAAST